MSQGMKRILVICSAVILVLIVSAYWQSRGLWASGSKLPFAEHWGATVQLIGAMTLAGVLCCILKRWHAAGIVAFAAICFFVGNSVVSSYRDSRRRFTEKALEDAYDRLARRLDHLPERLTRDVFPEWRDNHLVSHGYWRDQAVGTFELYYHWGSDSYVLRYPKKEWQWRNDGYTGPEEDSKSLEPKGHRASEDQAGTDNAAASAESK